MKPKGKAKNKQKVRLAGITVLKLIVKSLEHMDPKKGLCVPLIFVFASGFAHFTSYLH